MQFLKHRSYTGVLTGVRYNSGWTILDFGCTVIYID